MSTPRTKPATTTTDAAAPEIIDAGAMIPASDLMPSVRLAESEEAFWVWVGTLPHCPIEALHIGGICFPKLTETPLKDASGTWVRVAHTGDVLKLTRTQLRKIAERLAHKLLREIKVHGEKGESRIGGVVCTIPSAADIAARKDEVASGRATRVAAGLPFVRRESDRPLADFVYLQVLDEVSPRQRPADVALPEPLSATGIEIPAASARPIPTDETLTRATLPNPGRAGAKAK